MAKRWYFQTKTRRGNTLNVDIFDDNYSGTAINLSKDVSGSPGCPAIHPVTIDEELDSDMFNVLRMKTGYLNFIELTPGGLKDLYAKTNTQFMVSISLNSNLIFVGYIQAQVFQAEYLNGFNKVKIPIMSLMKAYMDEPIDASDVDSYGFTSIGELIEYNFSKYQYIVMPELPTEDEDGNDINPLSIEVMNRKVAPYNDDYNYGVQEGGETPALFVPITKGQFLEGVCRLYGLIAHDVADTLLLTKAEWQGDYIRMEVGELSNPDSTKTVIGSSTDVIDFYDTFNLASDKQKEGAENSLSKLEIEFDRTEEKQEISLEQSTYTGNYVTTSAGPMAVLELKNDEVTSSYLTTSSATYPSQNFTRIVGNGDEYIQSMGVQTANPMFSANFDTPRFLRFNILRIKINKDFIRPVKISVSSGGMYYNFGDEGDVWIDSPSYKELTFNSEGESVIRPMGTNGKTLTVDFFVVDQTGVAWEIFVENISLEFLKDESVTAKYVTPKTNGRKTKVGDTGGTDTDTIESIFLMAHSGVIPGLSYPYIAQSQRVLKLETFTDTPIDELEQLIDRTEIDNENGYWRTMAIQRDLSEDEYTLMLMHSDIIDN